MLTQEHIDRLTELRHELHRHPELSGNEAETAQRIVGFLNQFQPDKIITKLGRHGVAAIFNGTKEGPTTMIRCELDALPIEEANQELDYKSQTLGISHKCGHDGHMTIVSGLAKLLQDNPPAKGRVVLLFQSAEETGQGARWILQDDKFKEIQPDYAFALHNLPGYPLHQVLTRPGTFCAASQGVKIKLTGITSHASEPEKGVSPALAVSQLIPLLVDLPNSGRFEDFVLVTLTHTAIGEKTFGVSPADAEIYLTIRAYLDKDLNHIMNLITKEVNQVATNLQTGISTHEVFEATMNHSEEVDLIRQIASETGLEFQNMDVPNRWSEDFGLFLQQSKGAMFGLGSGLETPALHNPNYDFPNELIESGMKMFWGLIKTINYSERAARH